MGDPVSFFLYYGSYVIIFIYLMVVSFKQNLQKPWRLLIVVLLSGLAGHVNFQLGLFYIDVIVLVAFLGLLIYPIEETDSYFTFGDKPLVWLITSTILGLIFSFLFFKATPLFSGQVITIFAVLYVVSRAIGEEIFFRGFLLNDLQKYNINPLVANLVQTFIFVVGHKQSYHSGLFVILVSVFSLSAGFMTMKRGTLVYSIVIHCVTNLVVSYITQPTPLILFFP